MNFNATPKFLIHQNGEMPINTQFSGIFSKSSLVIQQQQAPVVSSVDDEQKIKTDETSSNMDYEFVTPFNKTKDDRNFVASSPNKELNLTEYFGRYFEKPTLLRGLNDRQIDVLRRVSKNVPVDGIITFKKNESNNDLTNVIFYNPVKSTAINHNIITPSTMNLIANPAIPQPSISSSMIFPVKRKVGRPRNDSKKLLQEIDPFEEDELISHRTKSGRIVKLNPDIAKIFKVDSDNPYNPPPEPPQPVIVIPQPRISPQPVFQSLPEQPRKPRKISSQFRCPTCKKVYLGKNKMSQHFKAKPDHRPKSADNESALFNHLMTLVRQKRNNRDMANVFFKELSNFVTICEKLTPKLITNQENHPNTHHQKIDKHAASVLRINPGNYKLNMNVFDKSFKFDSPAEQPNHAQQEQEHVENHHEEHHHESEPEVEVIEAGHEVIKALDDVPSLDGNEVNLLIRQTCTNELTNLTNISDIVGETDDF